MTRGREFSFGSSVNLVGCKLNSLFFTRSLKERRAHAAVAAAGLDEADALRAAPRIADAARFGNHDRYTLCASRYHEGHEGDWRECQQCREGFETEIYVWYATNEYNFVKLENAPE